MSRSCSRRATTTLRSTLVSTAATVSFCNGSDATGTPAGLLHATKHIYQTAGVRGLLQGHSATLLRVFPYAGIKFLFYDWIEKVRFRNISRANFPALDPDNRLRHPWAILRLRRVLGRRSRHAHVPDGADPRAHGVLDIDGAPPNTARGDRCRVGRGAQRERRRRAAVQLAGVRVYAQKPPVSLLPRLLDYAARHDPVRGRLVSHVRHTKAPCADVHPVL